MTRVAYALQITTDTSATDRDFGLVNGVIKVITGRDRAISGWKHGLIAKDGLGTASQDIEISYIGRYATMSGMNFTIPNQTGFGQRLKDLEIDLLKCEVKYFCVHDTTFSEIGTYKVSQWEEGEVDLKISCMDAFRSIHKPLLKRVFTTAEFGDDLPSDLAGDPIPVTFGYGSKSKLFPIVRQEVYETVCQSNGVSYDVAPCTNYTDGDTGQNAYKIVHIKTVDKVFTANELAGKFLTAVKVGNQTRRITGNAGSSGGITQVYIESPFDTALTSSNYWSATGESVWYFQISSLSVRFLASQTGISEFQYSDFGRANLHIYDTTAKEWVSISDLVDQSDTADLDSTGYPGISVISKPINLDGDALYYVYAVPESLVSLAERTTNTGAVSGSRPTSGTELTYLKDRDNTTGYSWVVRSNNGSAGSLTLPFRIKVPEKFLTTDLSNIYFAFNHDASFDNAPGLSIFVDVKLIDFLGRTTAALDSTTRYLYDDNILLAFLPLELVPWKYFNPTSSLGNVQFENAKEKLKLNESAHITKPKDLDVYPYAVFEVKFQWITGTVASKMTLGITEVTLVGEKTMNLISTNMHSDIIGMTFGSTWGGRRTSDYPVTTITDVVEKVFRDYDGRGDVIDTSSFDNVGDPFLGLRKDWVVGRQIVDEVDSYNLVDELCGFGFFGIVPKGNGTRAAKCWIESPAPNATHDSSVFIENSVGSKELTPIANLYNEFEIRYNLNPATDKYDGIYKVSSITATSFPVSSDYQEPIEDLGGFNIFLYEGSIMVDTDLPHGLSTGDYVSLSGNGLGFDFLPARISVVTAYTFTVDVDIGVGEFGSTDGTLSYIPNPVPTWKTYTAGFTNDQYWRAKGIWDNCHLSYTKYGVVRKLPAEQSECPWFINPSDWSLSTSQDTALLYLEKHASWTPFRKEIIPYSVPNVSAHASLELLSEVEFNDSVATNGDDKRGWIISKTFVAGTLAEEGKDVIDLRVMLEPEI